MSLNLNLRTIISVLLQLSLFFVSNISNVWADTLQIVKVYPQSSALTVDQGAAVGLNQGVRLTITMDDGQEIKAVVSKSNKDRAILNLPKGIISQFQDGQQLNYRKDFSRSKAKGYSNFGQDGTLADDRRAWIKLEGGIIGNVPVMPMLVGGEYVLSIGNRLSLPIGITYWNYAWSLKADPSNIAMIVLIADVGVSYHLPLGNGMDLEPVVRAGLATVSASVSTSVGNTASSSTSASATTFVITPGAAFNFRLGNSTAFGLEGRLPLASGGSFSYFTLLFKFHV